MHQDRRQPGLVPLLARRPPKLRSVRPLVGTHGWSWAGSALPAYRVRPAPKVSTRRIVHFLSESPQLRPRDPLIINVFPKALRMQTASQHLVAAPSSDDARSNLRSQGRRSPEAGHAVAAPDGTIVSFTPKSASQLVTVPSWPSPAWSAQGRKSPRRGRTPARTFASARRSTTFLGFVVRLQRRWSRDTRR